MNDTSPARRDTATTLPSSFHVSSTPNPSTSRYHATLRSRSFTVKLGDAERSARGALAVGDLMGTTVAFRDVAFFARVVLVGFFAAMIQPPDDRGYNSRTKESCLSDL